MKLSQNHFIKDEKPDQLDYTKNGIIGNYKRQLIDKKAFQKALQEWERKYIKPKESEWNLMLGTKNTAFKKALQHFNDNQVLFEWWELLTESQDDRGKFTRFQWVNHNPLYLYLRLNDDNTILLSSLSRSIYHGPCSVQLFRDICKENDIKL